MFNWWLTKLWSSSRHSSVAQSTSLLSWPGLIWAEDSASLSGCLVVRCTSSNKCSASQNALNAWIDCCWWWWCWWFCGCIDYALSETIYILMNVLVCFRRCGLTPHSVFVLRHNAMSKKSGVRSDRTSLSESTCHRLLRFELKDIFEQHVCYANVMSRILVGIKRNIWYWYFILCGRILIRILTGFVHYRPWGSFNAFQSPISRSQRIHSQPKSTVNCN